MIMPYSGRPSMAQSALDIVSRYTNPYYGPDLDSEAIQRANQYPMIGASNNDAYARRSQMNDQLASYYSMDDQIDNSLKQIADRSIAEYNAKLDAYEKSQRAN